MSLTDRQKFQMVYFCGYPAEPIEIIDDRTKIFAVNHKKLLDKLDSYHKESPTYGLLMVFAKGCAELFVKIQQLKADTDNHTRNHVEIDVLSKRFQTRCRILAAFLLVPFGPPPLKI